MTEHDAAALLTARIKELEAEVVEMQQVGFFGRAAARATARAEAAEAALRSLKTLCAEVQQRVAKAQYAADELGQGLTAWEDVDDMSRDGTFAALDDQFAALADTGARHD